MTLKLLHPVPVDEFDTWLESAGVDNCSWEDDDDGEWGTELEKDGHSLVVLHTHRVVEEVRSCGCSNDPLLGLFAARFGPLV